MEKNYSKSEILKFLYGELNPEEEKDFIEALYSDEELFKEFEELQEAQAGLNTVVPEFEPSTESLAAVMDYVKSTEPPRKRTPLSLLTSGKVPGFKFFATVSMVVVCCITVGFFMVAYQKAAQPNPTDPQTVTHWDAPGIRQRLDFVRTNLGNLSGERHLPYQLRHETYRLVNTADFNPQQPDRVVLVKVK